MPDNSRARSRRASSITSVVLICGSMHDLCICVNPSNPELSFENRRDTLNPLLGTQAGTQRCEPRPSSPPCLILSSVSPWRGWECHRGSSAFPSVSRRTVGHNLSALRACERSAQTPLAGGGRLMLTLTGASPPPWGLRENPSGCHSDPSADGEESGSGHFQGNWRFLAALGMTASVGGCRRQSQGGEDPACISRLTSAGPSCSLLLWPRAKRIRWRKGVPRGAARRRRPDLGLGVAESGKQVRETEKDVNLEGTNLRVYCK